MPARPSTPPLRRPGPGRAPSRLTIREPRPVLDCGRYAAKRTVGETLKVSAEIFADGHDVVRAVVAWRGPGHRRWREAPLRHIDAHVDGDTWTGEILIDALGDWAW